MSFNAFLTWLAGFLSVSSRTPGSGQVPEGDGWLALGALFVVFGTLVWWLYASPIDEDTGSTRPNGMGTRARFVLSALILLSGALFTLGARWDELWHRIYGGFGDDFLWPPHLMIYGALGLNSAFAGFGLAIAACGGGGVRARFRANPLVGLLGLISAYELASIPSDLLWHKIIGPDISAWALPHFLLELSSSAVLFIGLALALSTRPRRSWQVGGRPGLVDLAALALLTISTLAMLQFGVTEWEWRIPGQFGLPFDRPVWVYPVVVLLIGAAESHLILHATRRVGTATALALIVLAAQWVLVAISRAALPPGPNLVSHLLLVAPALALDLWYASRLSKVESITTVAEGAALYALVALVTLFAAIQELMPYPSFSPRDLVVMLSVGLVGALLVAYAARALGAWLNGLAVEPLDAATATVRRRLQPAPARS
jgi:hypothetical protein